MLENLHSLNQGHLFPYRTHKDDPGNEVRAKFKIHLISNNICYNFKFHAVKQATVLSLFLFVDATRALTVYADARVGWLRTLLNFSAWKFSP